MRLNENDKNRLFDFYGQALKNHGPHSPRALRWVSEKNQIARFKTLCAACNPSSASVLDVGCGVGDLYGFIARDFSGANYLGIDIFPEMVKQARLKYPNGKFWAEDIFDLDGSFDCVLASGAFTFNIENGREFYFQIIAKMFSLARRTAAFNMLDLASQTTTEEFLAYDKTDVAKFCQTLTPNYQIMSDYELGDFTVVLKKMI